MQIKAPYTLAAAVLVLTGIGIGLLNRPATGRVQLVDPPLILNAPSVAGRGNAAPSSSSEGVAPAAKVGTPSLLERAQAGDARAQWKLGEKLHSCSLALAEAERGHRTAESDECEREGITRNEHWRGWQAKAIAAGDPLALLNDVLLNPDPEKFAIAADVAARSGDPEAQILLGHMLLNEEPVDGLAWILVGCGDCTLEDPRLGFAQCVEDGSCPSNTRFRDYLASAYSQEIAQEAQARAESLDALYAPESKEQRR